MNKTIDIIKIQESIQKKHNEFLDNFGAQLEKVSADHKLFVELAITKLKYIIDIFQKLGIINEIIEVNSKEAGYDYDYSYKCLKLSKLYNDNCVYIVTNGFVIILPGTSNITPTGIQFTDIVNFKDICSDDFDWVSFSMKLLEHIHSVIFERKRAGEIKLDSQFKPNK